MKNFNARGISWLMLLMILATQSFGQSKTVTFLKSISGSKTVSGEHNREPNSNPTQYTAQIFSTTGKYPALWSGDFLFASSDISARQTMINQAKTQWSAGAVINLMYHACPPTQGEPCAWSGGVLSSLTNAQWTELTTNGTALNNTWKARLDVIAGYLQDLKNNGVEVLFRPFHEMNQGVFWWAGRPGASGTVKLYQITHDYLVNTKGLTNLIWVWDLQDFSSLSSDLTNYDPGSSYWDVLAMDMYSSDGQGYTSAKYNAVASKAGTKPMAIGECQVLPTSSLLASQPKWTFFMGWAELVFSNNSTSAIQSVYGASNVLTRDEMPGWAGGGGGTGTGCTGSYNNLPATIQAENYCSMSGIQTETTTDTGGGLDVGYIETNDWMGYRVNVSSTGSYTVQYRVASQSGGGSIRLEKLGGGSTFGTISVPSTGGWQTWTTITQTVQLTAGQQDIGLVAAAGGFNINWLSITGGGGGSTSTNLAYNRPVTTSSNENTTNTGPKAVDANGTTRWSSAYSDPQWIYVDLGAVYNVNRIKITWETALGKNYSLEGSTNASTWTNIKTITNNTALVNDNTGLSAKARYIRMYGTARGTTYGYSIYELEVYGTYVSARMATEEMQPEGEILTAFPNPVEGMTTIQVNLKEAGHTLVNISGSMGNTIAELHRGQLEAGRHEFKFNSEGLKPGIYFYTVVHNGSRVTKKLMKQ
jgi:hypothetical protein